MLFAWAEVQFLQRTVSYSILQYERFNKSLWSTKAPRPVAPTVKPNDPNGIEKIQCYFLNMILKCCSFMTTETETKMFCTCKVCTAQISGYNFLFEWDWWSTFKSRRSIQMIYLPATIVCGIHSISRSVLAVCWKIRGKNLIVLFSLLTFQMCTGSLSTDILMRTRVDILTCLPWNHYLN